MPNYTLLVYDKETKEPIHKARVTIRRRHGAKDEVYQGYTGKDGVCIADVPGGEELDCKVEMLGVCESQSLSEKHDKWEFHLPMSAQIRIMASKECESKDCAFPVAGTYYTLHLEMGRPMKDHVHHIEWIAKGAEVSRLDDSTASIYAEAGRTVEIAATAKATLADGVHQEHTVATHKTFGTAPVVQPAPIALQRSAVRPTQAENLWTLIRANERAIGFSAYREFINRVLCHSAGESNRKYPTYDHDAARFERERNDLVAAFGVGVYELLRTATELFLLLNCRTKNSRRLEGFELVEENARRNRQLANGDLKELAQSFLGHNQYIHHIIDAAFPSSEHHVGDPFCDGVLLRKDPCLMELIWSYWHEEAMLTQSIQAIARRFQNHHARGPRDPLAHFELDPLRPLNNIMWGYVQEEYKRLTVPRRALEYSHQYGLTLYGKANPGARSADPRSKFLESFHNLLHRCHQFFKEDNDTTVIADGFPLLNALRETHLVLAQGAHNQFGDLPWTARVEMLIEQWIMARSETRDFLGGRIMVPYTEAWMPQVETMKTLQSWTDVSVRDFHDLGIYGEQILLSVRYGDWVNIHEEDVAKNWARYWRAEIQSYLHAYRAAVGVDLTSSDSVDATVPGLLLQRRLDAQARAR